MAIITTDLYSGNDRVGFNFDDIATKYQGVFFKAGQGKLADVPRLKPLWKRQAQAAGLKVGWYWLMDSRYHPADQVAELEKALKGDVGELGIYVDAEKYRIQGLTDTQYWATPFSGMRNMIDFVYLISRLAISRFEQHLPGIYTGPGFFSLIARNATADQLNYLALAPLWTAQYPWLYVPGVSKPTKYGKWAKHTFWQYREGPDNNLFNGSDSDFAAYCAGYIPATPQPIPPDRIWVGYVISARGVKVHEIPSKSSASLGPALPKGSALEIDNIDGDWAHFIEVNGQARAGWSAIRDGGQELIDVEYDNV